VHGGDGDDAMHGDDRDGGDVGGCGCGCRAAAVLEQIDIRVVTNTDESLAKEWV
jgi:hypothetical protein